MKKYVGKKWGQLTTKEQEELLMNVSIWDNVKIGECIIDFNENLSVLGELIEAGDYPDIVINNNAILYDSKEGVIIENEKFKDLISLKDAAIMFNKDESTLRRNIKNGFFKEWEDCIKFGKQWVFDVKALEKKYNSYDKFVKELEKELK